MLSDPNVRNNLPYVRVGFRRHEFILKFTVEIMRSA